MLLTIRAERFKKQKSTNQNATNGLGEDIRERRNTCNFLNEWDQLQKFNKVTEKLCHSYVLIANKSFQRKRLSNLLQPPIWELKNFQTSPQERTRIWQSSPLQYWEVKTSSKFFSSYSVQPVSDSYFRGANGWKSLNAHHKT